MKKLFSKSSTIVLALSMATILLALPSCKSVNPCLSTIHQTIDTIVMHDSVYVREVQRGDTVYLTRVEWRDRWRTRVERDTVMDVRVEKEVVQLPPERYVPKFYRWCTGLLFALLTWVAVRWWLRR